MRCCFSVTYAYLVHSWSLIIICNYLLNEWQSSLEVRVALFSNKPATLADAHHAPPLYLRLYLFLSPLVIPTAHLCLMLGDFLWPLQFTLPTHEAGQKFQGINLLHPRVALNQLFENLWIRLIQKIFLGGLTVRCVFCTVRMYRLGSFMKAAQMDRSVIFSESWRNKRATLRGFKPC